MNYKDVLRGYIAQSGLSLSEIAHKLNAYGYSVTKSYLSQLQSKNNSKGPASDDMNRALAEITNGDVEVLLAAALIERTPAELREVAERLFNLKLLKAEDKLAQDEYQNASEDVSHFETEIARKNAILQKLKAFKEQGVTQVMRVPVLGEIISGKTIDEHNATEWEILPVYDPEIHSCFITYQKDDSMQGARIHKDDKILAQSQNYINDGEIAVVHVDDGPAIIRRIKYFNDECMLLSENSRFDPLLRRRNEIQIRGKVIQVIFDPNKG